MSKPLIYLGTPYSKYNQGRDQAFNEACLMAAKLMDAGYNVFCPIAHSHAIETIGFPEIKDGDWWLEQDFSILKHCDQLMVYKMPGWDESYGLSKEIEYAKNNNIPIEYIDFGQVHTF